MPAFVVNFNVGAKTWRERWNVTFGPNRRALRTRLFVAGVLLLGVNVSTETKRRTTGRHAGWFEGTGRGYWLNKRTRWLVITRMDWDRSHVRVF